MAIICEILVNFQCSMGESNAVGRYRSSFWFRKGRGRERENSVCVYLKLFQLFSNLCSSYWFPFNVHVFHAGVLFLSLHLSTAAAACVFIHKFFFSLSLYSLLLILQTAEVFFSIWIKVFNKHIFSAYLTQARFFKIKKCFE